MIDVTKFVVGDRVVQFQARMIDGSPNVEIVGPLLGPLLPPLNRHGLRRLAAHLNSLADLIDSGQGFTAEQGK